jgi:HEPN domain-containing protein
MTRGPKTAEVSRSESTLYLRKAGQFAGAAQDALLASRHDAALLNAVHAAISSGDAITAALAGRRSADPDHQRAVDLLEQVVGRGTEQQAHLQQIRMLIAKKNEAEYESRGATPREADEAVKRANRVLAWAKRLVADAKI